MLLWDSLFLLLVAAPLLTGGVWMERPGLRLEYTQPGAAAVGLAGLLWWLARNGGDPARESRVCRVALMVWAAWTRALSLAPARALTAAWAAASALWFTTSLLRHRALGSGLADLGIFTNGIWNVAQAGFPFSSLKNGISLLADHQIFLLYPLGWLFPLWPSPELLLLLQALGLSSGGVALYLLARQRVGPGHPALPWLPLAYWMCGPLRAANRFDFHPEVFLLPLLLFAAYFLQERPWRKRALGAGLFLCALMAKESAGPVACGLGIAWLLGSGPKDTRPFTRACGAVAVLLGSAAFLADSLLVPGLFGVSYAYGGAYAPLGPGPVALALAPFTQPSVFFGRLFAPLRLKFLLGTLLPFGFLPLLAPAAALAALPGFLMLFLTAGDHRISLGYHYSIEPMTGLLFALPAALASPWLGRRPAWLLPLLILCSLLSLGRSEPFFWRAYQPSPHAAWLRDFLLPEVPQDRSVAASYGLVPHLSTRRWVNQLPFFHDDGKRPVDCVLIDPAVNNVPLTEKDLRIARATLASLRFEQDFRCGTLELYKRAGGPGCLATRPPCPEKE